MSDSYLYRYVTSQYTPAELAETGYTNDELISACEIQMASSEDSKKNMEKWKPGPAPTLLTRRDIPPIAKSRLRSQREATKDRVRIIYRRPPENDESLIEANNPVPGKIEFEFIPDHLMHNQAEMMACAEAVLKNFLTELQGLGYTVMEGGIEVNLLEPSLLKLRFRPGVRVRCDARFFPDVEFLLRRSTTSALHLYHYCKRKEMYAATGELPTPQCEWEKCINEKVKLEAARPQMPLPCFKKPVYYDNPEIDKYGRMLLDDIEKRLNKVREEKANGTYRRLPTFKEW